MTFEELPLEERDQMVTEVVRFLADRGYTIIAPGGGGRPIGRRRKRGQDIESMMDDEKLKMWLDDSDEWLESADVPDADAVKFLRARMKRAVGELRSRL